MPAIDEALAALGQDSPIVVTGTAGGGKSVVLTAVLERAQSLDWPALVIAADRMPESRTVEELGHALSLEGSPTAALAAVAAGSDALLIIDQLDAVGVVSGRHPDRLAIIESLLLEARAHPNIHVVLGCREFDLDNDRSLRQAIATGATRIRVGPLETSQVIEVLQSVGVFGEPSEREHEFLRRLNLALLTELAGEADHQAVIPNSITEIYDQFWDVKRRACASRRHGMDEWVETIDLLVDEMSARQTLAIPRAVLDTHVDQTFAMESEAVLTTLQRRTGFVHETFFDYSWSRRFVARSGKIDDLLTSSEQDLFRRSQVRQLLTYERSAEPAQYDDHLTWLLNSTEVRMHIKALVISLVASMVEPTDAPSGSLQHRWPRTRTRYSQITSGSVFAEIRLVRHSHRVGVWREWLSSSEEAARQRALWLLAGLSQFRPTEVAGLLVDSTISTEHPTELLEFVYEANGRLVPGVVEQLRSVIATGLVDDRLPAAWSAMLDVAGAEPPLAPPLAAAVLGETGRQGGEGP